MTLQLDATPDELKLFLDEAEEHLQALDEGLLHLEREGADPHILQEIFRAAHTLKGSSGAIGHVAMTDLTHVMENLLDRLRNGRLAVSREVIDALLQGLDLLRLLLREIRAREETVLDLTPALTALRALDQSVSPPTPPIRLGARTTDLTLTPAERARLDEITRAGGQPWLIALQIDTRTGLQAARALQVLLELAEIGQVVRSEPDQVAIEREQVGDSLHILLVSRWEESLIRDLLSHVGDISDIAMTPYHLTLGPLEALPEPVTHDGAWAEPPLSGGASAAAVMAPPRPTKTVRMDVARLDRLMNLVGELVIDRTRLVQVGSALDARHADDPYIDHLTEAALHIGRITDQLQEEIMKGRMLPIDAVLKKLPRLARDVATRVGKRVTLVITGGETELDRSILETISDPLIHLVRNAVDHGIEAPAERLAAGKPAEGEVRLTARHVENQIEVTIRDDGRGIDPEQIVAAAVRKGLVTAEAATRLTPAEAIHLIFTPGFSTASQISDISGRGVGMDIVRANIEKLNGSVQVSSVVGHGTTFVIRLPLTLAIIQALLVRVGGQIYALPIMAVVETLRISAADIQTVQQHETIVSRQRLLPLLRPRRLFGVSDDCPPTMGARLFVVVVRQGHEHVGLIVDELVGEQEIVIKPLGRFIGDVPGVAGATILGDGGVALILDIASLSKQALPGRQGG